MPLQHNFAFQAFRTVAEQRNFTKAAAKLAISPSALSQTIRQLEAKLNLRLFHRTTRSVSLTEAGQSLLVRITPLLDEMAHIFDELKQEQHLCAGVLKLTMPYIVWQTIVCPVLAEFGRRFPHIQLDIHISDGLIDIIHEGYDAGIRIDNVVHQNMVAFAINKRLASVIVGSQRYFERYPKPAHPSDLLQHRCINYRFQTSETLYPWHFQRNGETIKITPAGMSLTEERAMVEAAEAGLGLANVFKEGIDEALRKQTLLPVLNDWSLPAAQFYFYYPSRHYVSSKLKAFMDFLKLVYP
jgi:DNA-binding transcriptional LysR family regulator